MSYTIDQILGKTDRDNASVDANANNNAARQDAPSYAEFKDAHRYMGDVDVAPRQFDIRSPYGETAPRGDYAGQGYAQQGYTQQGYSQQGYAGQDYASQNYSAPQGYAGQGFEGQGYARTNYDPRNFGDDMRQGYTQQGYYSSANYYQGMSSNQNMWRSPFYGVTASQEMERKAELDGKLASVNGYARTQEKEEVHENTQIKAKAKKKLNAKGALILSLYLIVVAVVITLIGVNAGKINSGKAVVPASEVSSEVSD